MALTKEQKAQALKKAQDIFQDSKSAVFVKFNGLGANETNAMRADMTGESVGYSVLKKTLVSRALDDVDIEGERPTFEGELAVAYGDDLIAPARLVREGEKKYKENLSILGGIFDGKYMDKAAMTEIADIPPVPVLKGQFVSMINSPIQSFVSVLNQVAEKKEA